MIHLKKTLFGKTTSMVKFTETQQMTITEGRVTWGNLDNELDKEWFIQDGYTETTREEFDEFLKPLANEINLITRE